MSPWLREQFFSLETALSEPITCWSIIVIVAIFLVTWGVIFSLRFAGRLSDKMYTELIVRCRSWVVIAGMLLGPILLGLVGS